MKSKTYKLLLSAILLSIAMFDCSAQSEGIVIIVNNDNLTKISDKSEAKLYYLRTLRRIWKDLDAPIRPVNYSSDIPLKQAFLENILRMSDSRMTAYFKQKEYAESLPMPQSFASEEEVVNYVANHKGAIGYISAEYYKQSEGRVKSVFTLR